MRFQKYLQEKFAGSRKISFMGGGTRDEDGKIDVEFFVNPTFKEMRISQTASGDFIDCIRFFIDFDKKEVIIWNGAISHKKAIKSINRTKDMSKFYMGSATCKGSKMEFVGTNMDDRDHVNFKIAKDQVKKHQDWISKYFTNVNKF